MKTRGYKDIALLLWALCLCFSGIVPAYAQETVSTVANNIVESVEGLPAPIAAFSYLLGLFFGVWALIKLKNHVESPQNAPLPEAASRFLAAGAFLALPFMYDVAVGSVTDGFFPDTTDFVETTADSMAASTSGMGNISNGFSSVLQNIIDSFSETPAPIASFGYLMGLLLVVAGILKLREHIENPDKSPAREGLVRIFVGGAFLSLATSYIVFFNTITGGNDGAGDIGGIVSAGSGELDLYMAGCTSGSSKLDQVICNVAYSTKGLPVFLVLFSYLAGMLIGFWGLLKVKEHIEDPRQTQIWEPIARFVAAGAFFALPMIVTVMFNTLADGITPYAAESFNDANGATEGSLDEMMVKFVGNIFEPSRALFSWFAFVAGSVFIVIGISRLLKTSQDGPRGPGGIGTIMTFLTGGALVSFNPMIGAFSSSLFGTANVKTFATLAYADGMTNAEIAHVEAVYGAVIQFMIILGMVSFMWGIFVFR
ncbi:MAG: hypothetical protein KDJ15_07460, partial [Alphaproteobacteria bacterium]|nr:hypothetical protein [Alphaproteobacteria bacterium]